MDGLGYERFLELMDIMWSKLNGQTPEEDNSDSAAKACGRLTVSSGHDTIGVRKVGSQSLRKAPQES